MLRQRRHGRQQDRCQKNNMSPSTNTRSGEHNIAVKCFMKTCIIQIKERRKNWQNTGMGWFSITYHHMSSLNCIQKMIALEYTLAKKPLKKIIELRGKSHLNREEHEKAGGQSLDISHH